MTYETRSGRQFVVIATGAGPDATLAAFASGPGGRATEVSTPCSRCSVLSSQGDEPDLSVYRRVSCITELYNL
jgi:hypothetical protein